MSLLCRLGRHRWSDWVPIWAPRPQRPGYNRVREHVKVGETRRCLRCGEEERVRTRRVEIEVEDWR